MEQAATIFWMAIGVYVALGLVAAFYIHLRLLHRLDASADGASWGFRFLVTPGIIALWPILLRKAGKLRRGESPSGNPDGPPTARRIRRRQALLIQAITILIPLLFAAALLLRPAPTTVSDATIPSNNPTEESR